MNGIVPPASVAVAIAPVATAEAGVTVSAALDFWITNSEKEVVSAAEAMPEKKYSALNKNLDKWAYYAAF